eukprot:6204238-Pleurochrysis_carterae.AAC.4
MLSGFRYFSIAAVSQEELIPYHTILTARTGYFDTMSKMQITRTEVGRAGGTSRFYCKRRQVGYLHPFDIGLSA